MLGDVISRLPAEEVARTQILSSRWRRLWRSAPLNLEAGTGIPNAVVSRILAGHQGGGRRFRVVNDSVVVVDSATLDGWLQCPALNNLQVLELVSSVTISEDSLHAMLSGCPALDKFVLMHEPPRPLMPPCALRCSSTLRVAIFAFCQFPDAAAHQVHFPSLQHLQLKMVTISDNSLHAMLSGCPALNSILLNNCSGFRKFRINSLKLQRVLVNFSFTDDTEVELDELIVQDAPCLEELMYHEDDQFAERLQILIISAPKLRVLGWIPKNAFRRKLGITDFQTHPAVRESKRLHKPHDRMECLDLHLKKLWISIYQGSRSHVDIAKYFLLNASVLESMVLRVFPKNMTSDWWIKDQRRRLKFKSRASVGAQLDFTSE